MINGRRHTPNEPTPPASPSRSPSGRRISRSSPALRATAAGSAAIAVVHAFVAGGVESESERMLSVGGSDRITAGTLHGFGYVSLGHLHTPQVLNRESRRYSGSPLPYSFSETAPKQVVIADLSSDGTAHVTPVAVPVGRPVAVLQGMIDELLGSPAHTDVEQHFVRAVPPTPSTCSTPSCACSAASRTSPRSCSPHRRARRSSPPARNGDARPVRCGAVVLDRRQRPSGLGRRAARSPGDRRGRARGPPTQRSGLRVRDRDANCRLRAVPDQQIIDSNGRSSTRTVAHETAAPRRRLGPYPDRQVVDFERLRDRRCS